MADPNYIALPEGVAQGEFTTALQQFAEILGAQNVLTDAEQLLPYMKIMMPVDEAQHAPSAALLATEVDQVQRIVRVCNEHRIPIWPISTGKNLGYGGTPPGSRGQVILDLKRMNRIIDVDPELCTALVEPGVTISSSMTTSRRGNIRSGSVCRHRRPSSATGASDIPPTASTSCSSADGGGPCERRVAPDRDGRQSQCQHLAGLQVGTMVPTWTGSSRSRTRVS